MVIRPFMGNNSYPKTYKLFLAYALAHSQVLNLHSNKNESLK